MAPDSARSELPAAEFALQALPDVVSAALSAMPLAVAVVERLAVWAAMAPRA